MMDGEGALSRPIAGKTPKTRPCKRCGRPVVQNPAGGAPRLHCPDSADKPGISCLDLDKRERDALENAGLGELLTAYRVATEAAQAALAPALGPVTALLEHLQHLDDLVDRIEQSAVAGAQQAEAARLGAEAAQVAAQRDARAAAERSREDRELRDEAIQARDDALESEDRVRQQARRDVTDAQRRAEEAERARGHAEGTATEHRRALAEEQQRRQNAEHLVRQRGEQLDTAHEQNTVLAGERDTAWRQASQDHARIGVLEATNDGLISTHTADQAALNDRDRQLTELRQHWTAATDRANALAQNLSAVHREHAELERTVARLTAELDAAHSTAETERTALASQIDDADRKYEGLLTALAGGGFTARTNGASSDESGR